MINVTFLGRLSRDGNTTDLTLCNCMHWCGAIMQHTQSTSDWEERGLSGMGRGLGETRREVSGWRRGDACITAQHVYKTGPLFQSSRSAAERQTFRILRFQKKKKKIKSGHRGIHACPQHQANLAAASPSQSLAAQQTVRSVAADHPRGCRSFPLSREFFSDNSKVCVWSLSPSNPKFMCLFCHPGCSRRPFLRLGTSIQQRFGAASFSTPPLRHSNALSEPSSVLKLTYLCPDLRRDHGLLGADGGHEVLLGQEVQRELDQEAAYLAQLLLSPGLVGLREAGLGLVLLQLGHVPHQGRWKAPEHLDAKRICVGLTAQTHTEKAGEQSVSPIRGQSDDQNYY